MAQLDEEAQLEKGKDLRHPGVPMSCRAGIGQPTFQDHREFGRPTYDYAQFSIVCPCHP